MAKIPDAYLKIITPLIHTARGFLENGESLAPVAFVGNFETGIAIPILLDSASAEAKDYSARAIKKVAEEYQADFIFMMMEAWTLRKDKVRETREILDSYGSIGASPYAVDIIAMTLETLHGVWMAEACVKPKGLSKKKRTFDEPEFHLFTEIEGRFVDLLPRKFGHGPTGTLH